MSQGRRLWIGLILGAMCVAFVSFFFVDRYVPQVGILWNAMHAKIQLFPATSRDGCISLTAGFRIPPLHCGWAIGYRWVLLICTAVGGFAVFQLLTARS